MITVCVCMHTRSLLCLPLFPITYKPLSQVDKGGVTGNYNFMKMSNRYRYEWRVWRRLKEKLVYLTSGNQKEREVMDAPATWKAFFQACSFWNTLRSPTSRNKSRRKQNLLDVLVPEQFVSLINVGFFDKRNTFFNCIHYKRHCVSVRDRAVNNCQCPQYSGACSVSLK